MVLGQIEDEDKHDTEDRDLHEDIQIGRHIAGEITLILGHQDIDIEEIHIHKDIVVGLPADRDHPALQIAALTKGIRRL